MEVDTLQEIKTKSDIESIKHREDGNFFYGKSWFFGATVLYNKALNYAESKENLALAYGNRSAVYLKMKKYNECLENIKLARQHGYPIEKIKKLDERQENCLKLIESSKCDEEFDFFKLSYPANEKIPWIIDGLEMRRTSKYGRGIFTTRDLKPGDIISIENVSTVYGINDNDYYKNCANCLKIKMLNLMPCKKSASFMFCSNECRDEFYQHVDFSSKKYNGLEILLSKIKSAFGGGQKLERFLRAFKIRKFDTSIFDLDYTKATKAEIQLHEFKCFLTSSYAKKVSIRFDRCDSQTKRFLKRLYGIQHYNMLSYGGHDERLTTLKERFLKYPPGILVHSAFFSLVNYSCIPNVNFLGNGDKFICFVKRNIKANEQIFNSPFGEFHNDNISRLEETSMKGFKCDCLACKDKIFQKELKREFPYQPLPTIVNRLTIKNLQDAIHIVKNNFEYLKKCTEITSLERSIVDKNICYALLCITSYTSYPNAEAPNNYG
ncbi:hypothetical protein PVAND_009693 [Polypedilum vanderplanki]|uniref:SET domain-containing protein n=1 Tax=Polypedilum vanderplanki TaxID=319348 RepID=A0A9J6CEC0_POLVA|nr:hypothetical protein PVAND_009693 [Polypedilum vanderplanki]